ncbi:FMN-binding negative transcriptional regulator [Nocardioides ferulae]|uniref:FMN-binding negative transcriptional regulator n=1 Tax=Nocardioides ferulae TaxID=2340821 RepID=UPI000EB33D4E|nr:FMN-binding negative transcriptional regulator [Nocardioides ferulae]
MFIQPWDAALEPAEWQAWVAGTDRFGVLAVNNLDPAQAPFVIPTHFTVADGPGGGGSGELLLHLARPNPVWPHLAAATEVRLAMVGDYAYVPTHWRARPDGVETDGVATSYYTAVQFRCRPTIVDDPAEKAALLAAQLADLQPEGRYGEIAADQGPYARMLPGLRGVRLEVLGVDAKFKYDDHKPREHRERVIDRLEQRGQGLDAGAARQQRRRLDAVGETRRE